jgi:hypothetical protein
VIVNHQEDDMRSWDTRRDGRAKTRRRLVATTLAVTALAAATAQAAASSTVSETRAAVNDVPAAVGSCLTSETSESDFQEVDDSYRAAAAAMGLFIPQVTQNGETSVVAKESGHNLRLQFTYDLTVSTSGDVTVQKLSIEWLCGA